jgi:lipoprotein NlpI
MIKLIKGVYMSDKRDPWEFVKLGQNQAAINAYSLSYDQDGRPSHLYNRGLVHLIAENYDEALNDFRLVTSLKKSTHMADNDYIYQGVCYWYLNRPSEAVDAWRQSMTAPYTDAAGGVETPALLLYAAERLHDEQLQKEALQLLRKHARRKLGAWPGMIVPFLLGKIDAIALSQSVKAARNTTLEGRWQCQADFYVALQALRLDDWEGFRMGMKQCAESSYGLLEQEYYLARWETKRGFPDRAFA